MKITSFGCSLTFGAELNDYGTDLAQRPFAESHHSASQLTWPAQVAKNLGLDYLCLALGGSGNLCILDRVLHYQFSHPDDILIINWTFVDRFDYSDAQGRHFDNGHQDYKTIRPSDASDLAEFYFKHIHSDYRDKFTSLIYVKTAVDTLCHSGHKFLMTCVDDAMLGRRWHSPPYIAQIQEQIRPYISSFEDKNFLTWVKDRGYPITADGHPLEEAHTHAAKIMLPAIESILHKA